MAVKTQKKATSIDMTAMCDVAFLLLTFFILTATAKIPEALPVVWIRRNLPYKPKSLKRIWLH